MPAQEIVFYKARPQPHQLTRNEAGAILNAVIEKYAAEHKINYPAAATALRDEAPDLFRYWLKIK